MTRLARIGLLALAIAGATTGCRSHGRDDDRTFRVSWNHDPYRGYFESCDSSSPDGPKLGLTDEQIARAIDKSSARATRRHEEALLLVASVQGASVATVATAVSGCYALGDRDAADLLADGTRGVWNWDRAEKVAFVECFYRSRGPRSGGALELTVRRRAGVEGPLAVAFPPGTYGVAADDRWTNPDDDHRFGRWPSQQDLGLLRAPVIQLGPEDTEGSILVPIACASFESGPPATDQRYVLHRFEKGSKIDRLLVALCARERTPEAEAQLAVWLARNDISWDDFVSKGGHRGGLLTFGGMNRILPRHGAGAARLLMDSGTNPGYSTFFVDHREPQEAPAAPSPAPEPEKKTLDATP